MAIWDDPFFECPILTTQKAAVWIDEHLDLLACTDAIAGTAKASLQSQTADSQQRKQPYLAVPEPGERAQAVLRTVTASRLEMWHLQSDSLSLSLRIYETRGSTLCAIFFRNFGTLSQDLCLVWLFHKDARESESFVGEDHFARRRQALFASCAVPCESSSSRSSLDEVEEEASAQQFASGSEPLESDRELLEACLAAERALPAQSFDRERERESCFDESKWVVFWTVHWVSL